MREPGVARKLLVVGVSALALVVCCGLAWWQWERFSSTNGTFQNLGYVLQWPLFGLAPAYMFWRFRKLKQREAAQPAPAPAPAPPPRPAVAHDDEDDELAAYNRYLADLNTRSNQESR